MFQRRVSVSGNEFRSFGNNKGLSAGRELSRSQHDGKQSDGRHGCTHELPKPTGNKPEWNSGGTMVS